MARWLAWMIGGTSGTRNARRGALVMLGLMVAVFFGLAGRLYDLQVTQHEHYSAKRRANSTRTITLVGTRGTIRTEDGVALAQTTFSGASLAVNPRVVPAGDRAAVAARVAQILGRDQAWADELHRQLYERREKAYYNIRREIDAETAARIRAACEAGELPGVEVRAIETREYPLGDFAAHIVGFVDGDMRGQEGVERALEKYLAAQAGRRVITVDALGRPLEGTQDWVEAPRDGADVQLTINAGIQAIVEEELRACVEKWDPVTVSVIVMETNTGAILGLANYPSFDPNRPGTDAAARKNISITDPFEPGSMFKPLIVCAAYQKGLLTPDSLIEYTPELKVPGRPKLISDHGHEIPASEWIFHNGANCVPVSTALVKSSNTVMTRIGLMLGCRDLHATVTGMGFGRRTGFDLGGPAFGESAGRVRPLEKWTVPSSIPSLSIGYEVQVTPMQMLNCFNAIANGGRVLKPYVVNRVVGADGRMLYQAAPEDLLQTGLTRQVTREMMNETLKRVVSGEGTAGSGALKEYRIAGKTGTAHKVKQGQYSSDKICSFVGYAPADQPVISVIVVVNEARAKVLNRYGWRIRHYGGTVAAPVMSRIVLRSLKHLGVPEDSDTAPVVEAPRRD
ncbi:MAG: penicillin-binding protein 2 [Planctomycetes bacterium]|nr:penicillin-binding protein 2 [Planctomycetota bacterium]